MQLGIFFPDVACKPHGREQGNTPLLTWNASLIEDHGGAARSLKVTHCSLSQSLQLHALEERIEKQVNNHIIQ
jgi:hypothetical protein